MTFLQRVTLPCVIASLVLWTAGCGGKPDATVDKDEARSGDVDQHEGDDHDQEGDGHEGHDHEGHDHDHPHGPHDGELIELAGSTPGALVHAEWTHEDAGLVTVYILDDEAKEELPIAASEVTIDVRVEEKEPETYILTAVSPDADGKSSRFEIDEPELLTALKLKDAVDAQLHVAIDGRKLAGKVEFKEHDHHH